MRSHNQHSESEGIEMVATIGRVKLTAGNLRNFHIYLRSCADLIPQGGVGGSSANERGVPFTVAFQPGSTIETDVAVDKMILRDRGAVRAFFEAAAADVGDVAVIERAGPRELSIWLEERVSGEATASVKVARSTNDRANVDRQLSRATPWIRETFSAIEALAKPYIVSERDEGGPGRQFRFANRNFIRVHPRLAKRIALGFPNGMRSELLSRGLLIDRDDVAWMNFDEGMDLKVVLNLIEQMV
jgi:hypothetical protein